MNRRGFLKGLLAAGAIAATPIKWAYNKIRYRLHGDGVTDDTEAMQALMDGEQVEMPDGSVQGGGNVVYIPRGTYRLENLPEIRRPGTFIIGDGK